MDDGGFPVEVTGGVPVVAAPEELDVTNAPQLGAALASAVADGHATLVVDMSRTRFCDCSGLHLLLAVRDRTRADGGDLVLAISGKAVLRLFEITGADHMIRHCASLEDALAQASPTGQAALPADGGKIPR
jgi:anti-sigma B factor antagonist